MMNAVLEKVEFKHVESPVTLNPIRRNRANANAYLIELLINEYNYHLSQGEVAPDGCWIEVAKCNRRKKLFQVFYRSSEPIFNGKKRQYIGMKGSKKHKQAEAAIYRRNHLNLLSQDIKSLQNGDKA